MSNQNFYNELDLKYIEIGYNMKDIDRTNPGSVPFNIPVLTPQMDNGNMKDSKVIQRDKSNIQNASASTVDVSDLEISNYIYIKVPRELCAIPSGEYTVTGNLSANDSTNLSNIKISGSVSEITGSVNGSGNFTGTASLTSVHGTLSLTPISSYRYIPKGSKWAICFIGGDSNMPMVLAKLPD